jgi:tetratricopeptide (TPR) repeat protein
MWLSDVLQSIGRFAEAHQAVDEIIATSTRLSAAEPSNASFLGDLGLGHLKKATLSTIEGKLEESAANFEQARSIFHGLASATGAAIEVRENEGSGLMGLSDTSFLLGDMAASKRFGEECVALYRKLAATDATDVTTHSYLAEALYSLGAALTGNKEFASARKAIDEALVIDRGMLKGGFASNDVKFDISTGQLLLGELLTAQGRPREALAPLRQSLDTRRQLAAAQPGMASLSRGVAETMHSLVVTPGSGSSSSWAELGQYLESMRTQGTFWPLDQGWLNEAHQHMGAI